MKEKGQIILVLILVMTVALAIGLSVVQKSLVDVSTASKVDQSSRAFSAAEAGIEKALKGDTRPQSFIDNNSQITNILDNSAIPCLPGQSKCDQSATAPQAALEYPPIAKEDVVQIWLADYNSTVNPPAQFYNPPNHSLDIFWGDASYIATDKPAIALTLVYYGTDNSDTIDPNTPKYRSKNWYLDNSSATRDTTNGFDKVACAGSYTAIGSSANTCSNGAVTYQCKVTLGSNSGTTPDPSFAKNGPLPANMMLIRAKLLYNTNSQPIAVQATGSGPSCNGLNGGGCYLLPQARSIVSTGVAGETQRKIKVCQINKVVPPYFDYALFSVGAITK